MGCVYMRNEIDVADYEGLPRNDSFTKDEWWDVARTVKTSLTREEFDTQWDEFIAKKAILENVRGSA